MSLKDRLAQKRKELATKGGDFDLFFIKEGTTRMRLMSAGDEKEFAIEAVTFYLGSEIKNVISPATFGKKCAIMEAYNELSASKDTSDREFAKKFKPGKKYYAAAYRYTDEKGKEVDVEQGVKLLQLTGGQYQDLIDLYLDEDEAGDFTHRTKGYDIKFGRTGKGKQDTEYQVRPCKNTEGYKPFYKDGTVDLEEMLKAKIPSYKETKEIIEKFLNLPPEEDNAAEEEAPKKKKKKKNKDL